MAEPGGQRRERVRHALASLVPPGVAVCVAEVKPAAGGGAPAPYPVEAALVAGAVDVRQREFAVGRACARAALADLGCPPQPIGRGRLGQPLWPAGFDGSITHGRMLAAAAAYPGDAGFRLGIDLVEGPDLAALSESVAAFLRPEEADGLEPFAGPSAGPPGAREAEFFSAKESALKALSAELGRYVDFLELTVSPESTGVSVLAPGGLRARVAGAWCADVLITVARAGRQPASAAMPGSRSG